MAAEPLGHSYEDRLGQGRSLPPCSGPRVGLRACWSAWASLPPSWAESLCPVLQLISCHYWPYTCLSRHTACPPVSVTLQLTPASGPLYWLCSLSGIVVAQVTLLLVYSLLKWLLLGETSLAQTAPLPQALSALLPYLCPSQSLQSHYVCILSWVRAALQRQA